MTSFVFCKTSDIDMLFFSHISETFSSVVPFDVPLSHFFGTLYNRHYKLKPKYYT